MEFQASRFRADVQRKGNGEPFRKLAKEAGISPSTLCRLEKGGMPDLLTYATACKWLGVSMDHYFSPKDS